MAGRGGEGSAWQRRTPENNNGRERLIVPAEPSHSSQFPLARLIQLIVLLQTERCPDPGRWPRSARSAGGQSIATSPGWPTRAFPSFIGPTARGIGASAERLSAAAEDGGA